MKIKILYAGLFAGLLVIGQKEACYSGSAPTKPIVPKLDVLRAVRDLDSQQNTPSLSDGSSTATSTTTSDTARSSESFDSSLGTLRSPRDSEGAATSPLSSLRESIDSENISTFRSNTSADATPAGTPRSDGSTEEQSVVAEAVQAPAKKTSFSLFSKKAPPSVLKLAQNEVAAAKENIAKLKKNLDKPENRTKFAGAIETLNAANAKLRTVNPLETVDTNITPKKPMLGEAPAPFDPNTVLKAAFAEAVTKAEKANDVTTINAQLLELQTEAAAHAQIIPDFKPDRKPDEVIAANAAIDEGRKKLESSQNEVNAARDAYNADPKGNDGTDSSKTKKDVLEEKVATLEQEQAKFREALADNKAKASASVHLQGFEKLTSSEKQFTANRAIQAKLDVVHDAKKAVETKKADLSDANKRKALVDAQNNHTKVLADFKAELEKTENSAASDALIKHKTEDLKKSTEAALNNAFKAELEKPGADHNALKAEATNYADIDLGETTKKLDANITIKKAQESFEAAKVTFEAAIAGNNANPADKAARATFDKAIKTFEEQKTLLNKAISENAQTATEATKKTATDAITAATTDTAKNTLKAALDTAIEAENSGNGEKLPELLEEAKGLTSLDQSMKTGLTSRIEKNIADNKGVSEAKAAFDAANSELDEAQKKLNDETDPTKKAAVRKNLDEKINTLTQKHNALAEISKKFPDASDGVKATVQNLADVTQKTTEASTVLERSLKTEIVAITVNSPDDIKKLQALVTEANTLGNIQDKGSIKTTADIEGKTKALVDPATKAVTEAKTAFDGAKKALDANTNDQSLKDSYNTAASKFHEATMVLKAIKDAGITHADIEKTLTTAGENAALPEATMAHTTAASEKALTDANEKQRLATKAQNKVEELKRTSAELTTKKPELEKKKAAAEKTATELEKSIDALTALKSNATNDAVKNSIEALIQTRTKEKDAATEEASRLGEETGSNNDALTQNKSDLESAEQEALATKAAADEATGKLPDANKWAKEAQATHAIARAEAELAGEIRTLTTKKTEHTATVTRLQGEASLAQKNLDDLKKAAALDPNLAKSLEEALRLAEKAVTDKQSEFSSAKTELEKTANSLVQKQNSQAAAAAQKPLKENEIALAAAQALPAVRTSTAAIVQDAVKNAHEKTLNEIHTGKDVTEASIAMNIEKQAAEVVNLEAKRISQESTRDAANAAALAELKQLDAKATELSDAKKAAIKTNLEIKAKAVNDARNALTFPSDIKGFDLEKAQKNIQAAEAELAKWTKVQELVDVAEKAQTNLDQAEKEKTVAENEKNLLDAKDAYLKAPVGSKTKELTDAIRAAEKKVAESKIVAGHSDDDKLRLAGALDPKEADKKKTDLKKKVDNLADLVKTHQKTFDSLKKQTDSATRGGLLSANGTIYATARLEQLQKTINDATVQRDAAKTTFDTQTQLIKDIKAGKDLLKNEADQQKKELETKNKELITTAKTDVETQTQALKDAQKTLAESNKELTQKKQDAAKAQADVRKYEGKTSIKVGAILGIGGKTIDFTIAQDIVANQLNTAPQREIDAARKIISDHAVLVEKQNTADATAAETLKKVVAETKAASQATATLEAAKRTLNTTLSEVGSDSEKKAARIEMAKQDAIIKIAVEKTAPKAENIGLLAKAKAFLALKTTDSKAAISAHKEENSSAKMTLSEKVEFLAQKKAREKTAENTAIKDTKRAISKEKAEKKKAQDAAWKAKGELSLPDKFKKNILRREATPGHSK